MEWSPRTTHTQRNTRRLGETTPLCLLSLSFFSQARVFFPSPLLFPRSHAQLVLDKESFTLEELLEEDDVIQECKSLNGRLINLCVHAGPLPYRPRRGL
jgi:hypothetical protein